MSCIFERNTNQNVKIIMGPKIGLSLSAEGDRKSMQLLKKINAADASNVPDIKSKQCSLFQIRDFDMLALFMQDPVMNFPDSSPCQNPYRDGITMHNGF